MMVFVVILWSILWSSHQVVWLRFLASSIFDQPSASASASPYQWTKPTIILARRQRDTNSRASACMVMPKNYDQNINYDTGCASSWRVGIFKLMMLIVAIELSAILLSMSNSSHLVGHWQIIGRYPQWCCPYIWFQVKLSLHWAV